MATRISDRTGRAEQRDQAGADDRRLVLEFQAGQEEAAYLEIHRRYAGLARHICQRILGNSEDAEEATQEAMLKVYRGLHQFNGRYALRPWVARIATNVAFDTCRARQRHPQPADRPLDELMIVDDREPAVLLERQLDRERLRATLDRLRANHRDALVLRDIEGRSHDEIAELLGTTPKQVKALICRARKAFRRAWDAREQPRGHLREAIGAIALLPFRLPDFARRLFGYARDTAEFAAALPGAAGTTGMATADRVAAAAMTVLIAGTTVVSVAAATPNVRPPEPPPTPIAASAREPRAGLVLDLPVAAAADAGAQRDDVGEDAADVPTAPVTTPTPVPTHPPTAPPVTASPTAAPTTASPTAPTSPATEPPIAFPTAPPVPPPLTPPMLWFEVSAGYVCDCGGMAVTSTIVEGSAGEGFAFRQEAGAEIRNPTEGGSPWSMELSVWATSGDEHTGGFILDVHQDGVMYRYEGTSVASVTPLELGGYRYASSGTYGRTSDLLAEEPPAVLDGTFALLVDTAPDGTSLAETHLFLSGS